MFFDHNWYDFISIWDVQHWDRRGISFLISWYGLYSKIIFFHKNRFFDFLENTFFQEMSFFTKKKTCGHVQPRHNDFKEHPSIQSIHPSIHPFIHPSIHPIHHPSVCLTVSMSARCRWRVPSSFLTSGFRCMRDTTWKSQKNVSTKKLLTLLGEGLTWKS